MMSVKFKYLASCFNNKYWEIWSSDCESLVVSTCVFKEVCGRQKKLVKHTGNTFLIATENNVIPGKMLIENYKFE